jgi:histidine decarboxylase
MISRRNFLGYSIAGAIGTVAGCRPNYVGQTSGQHQTSGDWSAFLEDKKDLARHKDYFLGYPINMNTPPDTFFTWRQQLSGVGFGEFGFNNVGNPFGESTIPQNSHALERELILRFGKLYGFPSDDTWGFLSHSGTDSNMHGMYMGRTLLKGIHKTAPICYFTKEAHYSVQILGDLLGLETVFVDTLADASMDTEDLAQKLTENANNPALVVATIGTTFKGGIDQIDKINQVLKGRASYLHLDAALFGGYLPHTMGSSEVLHRLKGDSSGKRFDSIAVSCHKFFGFPSPAGLFITTNSNFEKFNSFYSRIHDPEYIGHVPGTITCSRDAVKPAEFYYFSSRSAIEQQAKDAKTVLANTDYLLEEMRMHMRDLLPMRSNALSNTVYFKCPTKRIVEKYSLATMTLKRLGRKVQFAHVVIMPHVNKKVLGEFLTDLEEERAVSRG